MLANRLKVVIVIIPVGVFFAVLGGWPLAIFGAALMGVCAWEYWHMFTQGGFKPALWILIPGVALLVASRYFWRFAYSDALLALLVIISMGYHTLRMPKDIGTPAVDFSITVAGLMYLGWLGGYLISLRELPGGLWWLLLALPTIGLGDAGAYLVGSRIGKHPLAPNVSPHKTVEGYLGGVFFATIGGVLLALLWSLRYPTLTAVHGLVLGLVLGILTPLGDLGESMLKRQFNLKDAGTIFPGHGGMLDRMDSWLWGAMISYYLILWLW